MSSGDTNSQHKESLMHEINALFAPPTNESYGKKGSLGIVSFFVILPTYKYLIVISLLFVAQGKTMNQRRTVQKQIIPV